MRVGVRPSSESALGARTYNGLAEPVRRKELRDFARTLKSSKLLAVNPSEIARSIGLLIVLFIVWAFSAATLLTLAGVAFLGGYNPVTHVVFVLWFFAVPLFLAPLWILSRFIYVILRRDVRVFRPLRKWFILRRVADANGWAYTPKVRSPGYEGCIFLFGENRLITDQIRIGRHPSVEVGNYGYASKVTTDLGRHEWGYIAIQLERPMPHMILEARANRKLIRSRLPATFRRSQVLSLEGDFDRHFTLFAPREYERDALYVFTPDLMARLIDEASLFDVEIVDDRMYVYSEKPFDMLSPATYSLIDRITSIVGAKARSQTVRYRDDRAGLAAARRVGPQGRRLVRRVSTAAIVIAVVVVVMHLLPLFHF
jgi:hypothetical protein